MVILSKGKGKFLKNFFENPEKIFNLPTEKLFHFWKKMKAKIISQTTYYFECENGTLIPLDPKEHHHLIGREGQVVEGEYTEEEEQTRYTDGTYSRSYQTFPKS